MANTRDVYVTVEADATGAAKWLGIASRLINVGYAAFMAWQVAKALNPGPAIKEDLLIRKLKKRFAKPEKLTDRQIDDYIAEVTQYVREQTDAKFPDLFDAGYRINPGSYILDPQS